MFLIIAEAILAEKHASLVTDPVTIDGTTQLGSQPALERCFDQGPLSTLI